MSSLIEYGDCIFIKIVILHAKMIGYLFFWVVFFGIDFIETIGTEKCVHVIVL